MTEQNTEATQDLPTENVNEVDILSQDLPMDKEETQETEPEVEAEEVETEEAAETEETTESQETEESVEKPKKKVPGVKRRIDRERAKAANAIARAEAAERRLQALEQPKQPKAEDTGPQADDYEHGINDINYINARAEFAGQKAAEKRFFELQNQQQQTVQQTQRQQMLMEVENKYTETLDTAAEKYDDLDEVITSVDTTGLDPNVAYAIKDSDLGGEVFYNLCKDPKAYRDFQALPQRHCKSHGRVPRKLPSHRLNFSDTNWG